MFTFDIRPDAAATYKVTATSRDVVLWEKTTPGRTFNDLGRPAMADFYGLAHLASKRLGLFDGTRKEFEDSVDLEIVEDEEPDPTRAGPSPGE